MKICGRSICSPCFQLDANRPWSRRPGAAVDQLERAFAQLVPEIVRETLAW